MIAGTLAGRLAATSGPLPLDEARAWLLPVVEALAVWHGAGRAHLAVVADHVKADAQGVRLAGPRPDDDAVRAARGLRLPEQGWGTFGPASDVYMWGLLAFEVLMGFPPLLQDKNRVQEGAEPLSCLPPPWDAAVGGCLAWSPGDRWTAAEVVSCLQAGERPAASGGDANAVHLPQGHAGAVRGLAASPYGTIASLGEDGTVRLWRLGAAGTVRPALVEVLDAPGGQLVGYCGAGDLVLAGLEGAYSRWCYGFGNARQDLPAFTGTPEAVWTVGHVPCLLTSVSASDGVRWWRWEDRRREGPVEVRELRGVLPGHVVASQDGLMLAGVRPDGAIRVLPFPRNRAGVVIPRPVAARSPLATDAGGTAVAGLGGPGAVQVWHTHNGYCNTVVAGLPQAPTALALSPSGSHLAIGLAGGGWRLARVRDGAVVDGELATKGEVRALVFTASGDRLVAGTSAGAVWSWPVVSR
ncbi:MAG: protein kinase family protein [Candidatus Sericytochromatia bacterium]|nr:protein kinase family protein [Candidatus Sericytochromatia bacterium]